MSESDKEYDFVYDENTGLTNQDVKVIANEPYFHPCSKCNATKVFMIQCKNEVEEVCMICVKCLFHLIIETGTEQFCKDNKEFEGMLFGYKDKFKT